MESHADAAEEVRELAAGEWGGVGGCSSCVFAEAARGAATRFCQGRAPGISEAIKVNRSDDNIWVF